MTLADLRTRIHADLSYLNYDKGACPTEPRSSSGTSFDVVIVGGGQSGLGAAFGLLREGIRNILVIDENSSGFEGPWETYARMPTLRTPKQLTSIDLGIPSLTFRAWYEAQNGAAAWAKLHKIARCDWMAYLRWYREILELPVENNVRLIKIEPVRRGLYKLHVEASRTKYLMASKIILATGIQGGGRWHVPTEIAKHLKPHQYSHSSSVFDFTNLRHKRIGIVGGGASAFDTANIALDAGAKAVDIFIRRKDVQRINPIRYMEQSGLLGYYRALDDSYKYKVMADFFAKTQPPTNDTYAMATARPECHVHHGVVLHDINTDGETITCRTGLGDWEFDFLIASTGLITDPALRPELATVHKGILRWSDCYTAPIDLRNASIDNHPYMGSGFQYVGRDHDSANQLYGLYAFNYSALISLGLSASALSGLGIAIRFLVDEVASALFLDKADQIVDGLLNYDEIEFVG